MEVHRDHARVSDAALLHMICICGNDRCEGSGVPQDPYEYTHASGDCFCDVCGDTFLSHPMAADVPGFDGPFLHRLCNGELVKL